MSPATSYQLPRGKPNTIVVVKECSNKRTLMTFCYTHRSMSYSVIIREASPYHRWEQVQIPMIGLFPENERPWNTQPYMGCLHQISPLRIWGTLQKWRQKEYESQRDQITPKKQKFVNPIGSICT